MSRLSFEEAAKLLVGKTIASVEAPPQHEFYDAGMTLVMTDGTRMWFGCNSQEGDAGINDDKINI